MKKDRSKKSPDKEPEKKPDKKPDKLKNKAKRGAKKANAVLRLPAPATMMAAAFAPPKSATSDGMLERCRTQWQYGEWAELAALQEVQITPSPDRAKLALLASAGHSNQGDQTRAAHFLRLAVGWGCDAQLVSQVMISSVHNSLGRVAASLDDTEAATGHFETAIKLVEPRAATALLGRTRQVRETARMGLLPDAERLLQVDIVAVAADPVDHEARMTMIKAEIQVVHQELSLALNRRQIFGDGSEPGPGDDLSRLSMSQLGQDVWVLEQTGLQRGGFFVEFGATDGVLLSNTVMLERSFGWTGLCAEPNPKFFAELQNNRRCMVLPACIGSVTGERVRFILADVYGGIASLMSEDSHAPKRDAYRNDGQAMEMTTISLDDFLTQNGAPKVIDYLSIDTEGSEYEILRTFPFDKWTVRFITVEHNYTPLRDAIRALLEPLGYVRTEAKFDDWYALQR